jgi:hypothetical protein
MQTILTLLLPEELEGRVFIRTPAQDLVVEWSSTSRPDERWSSGSNLVPTMYGWSGQRDRWPAKLSSPMARG